MPSRLPQFDTTRQPWSSDAAGLSIDPPIVIGGNVAANVQANSYIRTFTIQRGSLLFGSTIGSTLGAIENFRIIGGSAYGLYGELDEPDVATREVR